MLSLAKSCGFAYAVCNTIVILCVSPVKGGEMEIRMIISISASEHLRQKKGRRKNGYIFGYRWSVTAVFKSETL